jgi:diguanylate cyclase (GGDEF)-like protein
MPAELAKLEASAHDDDAQSTLAHSIYTAVEAYMHDYALPLASRPDAVTGARLDRITRRGKRRFDTLRALFDRFDDGALAARAVAERSATAADHLFSGVALAGVGGLLSALLWFVVYTARVVIGPVRRAVRACAALARGERDTELPLTGPSEVRELAAGFNAMAARMAEHAEGLERKAARDPLTGLLNRRGFEAALEAHTVFGERYGPQGALLLMDLDNFKLVNDTLGHARGDELLLACARALTGRLRETDAIGRLGGDEFAVLLPQEGLAEGARVAAHLITAVADATRTVTGDHGITVTGSIGVAEFGAGEDGEDILARADAAMYEAKAAGRNRYAVAGAGALVAYGVRM